MKPVFVDTGAFAAFLMDADARHRDALDAFRRLQRQDRELVTTNAVVFETHALILNRDGAATAERFLDFVFGTSACRIERVSAEDERAAAALLRQRPANHWSFCDALSFVVMKRLHLTDALAYDDHFRRAGVTIVSERIEVSHWLSRLTERERSRVLSETREALRELDADPSGGVQHDEVVRLFRSRVARRG